MPVYLGKANSIIWALVKEYLVVFLITFSLIESALVDLWGFMVKIYGNSGISTIEISSQTLNSVTPCDQLESQY